MSSNEFASVFVRTGVALDRGVDVSNSDQTFFRDWSFNTFLGSIEYLERHKKKQEEK